MIMTKSISQIRDEIVAKYTSIEAGYVNNPNDLGGETNHGITYAVAMRHKNELVRNFKWDGTMRNLTVPMARHIYILDYWNKCYLDHVVVRHVELADKLFDIAINAGVSRAGRWFQEIVASLGNNGRYNKASSNPRFIDGWIGKGTMEAYEGVIKARGELGKQIILHALIAKQTVHYVDISLSRQANQTFTFGWLRRAYDTTKGYLGSLYR